MSDMKSIRYDAVGTEIAVGDDVAFILKEYNSEARLAKGRIIAFTPKKVVISFDRKERYGKPEKILTHTRLVKI